jgi:2-C-methyl-D-erythritol 4-phosphate cytidylyltransferase
MEWSLDAFARAESVGAVVVVLPEGVDARLLEGVQRVDGGPTRSESVANGVGAAPEAEIVVVHDAARPLVTPELVSACLDALRDADAAIAATPVTDTIKECAEGRVVRTLERSRLWAVQTPQVFRRAALEQALAQDDAVVGAATDDASLIEALGGTVRIVPAPPENLKVTTALDLRVAEMLLRDGLRRGGS